MRYEILGPLRLVDADRQIHISARRLQTILAVLLIRSDEMVTRDQLIAEIWGETPPRRAAAAVHVYISQLRRFLCCSARHQNSIVTRQPGYVLRKGHDEFDFEEFLRLVGGGRQQMRRGAHGEAVAAFEHALALWRGPALGDLRTGPIVEGFATQLTESRLETQEMLNECRLALGRHREPVGPLYATVAQYPLREVFYRQLMVALYRSEQQADALRVYHVARKTLDDQLGLEPCRVLRRTHQAILRGDSELELLHHDGRRAWAESA
jgi:SARP family transcriptional regulator, regulator of embCAB operon